MKISIEVDCTPEEARRFLGLPDVQPLQQAVMARLEKQALEAANAFSPEALLKAWLPLLPLAPEQFRAMMGNLFKPLGGDADAADRPEPR